MVEKGQYLREQIRSIVSEFFHKYSVPRWMLFIHDTLAVFVTFILAYLLRYNLVPSVIPIDSAAFHGLITTLIYVVFMLIFRSYAGLIRHTTLTDISLAFVTASSSTIILILLSLTIRFLPLDQNLVIPISVILIHYVLITVFLFSMRISVKMLFKFATSSIKTPVKKVLLYGAGEMGFIVKRVLLSDPRGGFFVQGFIDDNKHLQGKKINGIQVYGPEILSFDFIVSHNIQTLILSIRNIQPAKKSDIIQKAFELNLEVLETPVLDDWLYGHLEVGQLQKVKLEDLLGRDPIKLNMELIKRGLAKKTILITGAAGSIGSEIVRQLSRFNTYYVVLVDQAETPTFHLENELKKDFSHMKFKTQLADVTNTEKMELIFQKYHPEIVFHAAAYKHVPLLEENPHEAFRVNVGGTRVLLNLSVKYGVQKFVLISTDKSVNPTNIMGASKRLCEMLVQTEAMKVTVKTQFVITRFGNVLGSNGSVIPLFKSQIENGGPVTVTHPEISRYFMTIPEACQLVLEAGFIGKGGEIFVFDMGEPIKIVDLAVNMIRFAGFKPWTDIKIEFTGLRPGEKLFEELLSHKEEILPTYHEKIKVAKVEQSDFKNEAIKVFESLNDIYGFSDSEIIELFESLVPEYKFSKEKTNGHYLSQLNVDTK
jgi:FlaA1/EpsC-like NDP-sugar epimerase